MLLTDARSQARVSADGEHIAGLYAQLEEVDPSPLVTLNRAIAISEYDSPDLALAIIERLADQLDGHHAFHVARAELLRTTGRSADARASYDRAIDLAGNAAEIAHLNRRRNQLATPNGELS